MLVVLPSEISCTAFPAVVSLPDTTYDICETVFPLPELPEQLHGEAYVNYYVELAQDTFYAPAGTELYRRQIPVTTGVYLADEKTIVEKPLTVEEDENHVCITGEETEIIFDKKTGEFTRYQAKSVSFMTGGKDEFYRAPTGIDEGTHESDYDDIWRAEGLDRLKKEVQSVSAVSAGNQVLLEVQASYTAEPDNAVLFTAHTLYRIGSEGMELKNEVTNNSGLETIARVGQSFRLPAAFDTLTWYGKGPWETYADRKDAALIGLYTSSVAEQHVPFAVPCECGGHEDTRFAALSDGTHTVQIVGSDDFHFSALPYSIAEYRKATYEEELPEQFIAPDYDLAMDVRKAFFVLSEEEQILDVAHAGLGGDTGWTKNIHPEYRVCKGRYSYTFRFHFA